MIGLRHKLNAMKAKLIRTNKMAVADFGTRRRFSSNNHEMVIEDMKKELVGTSNVWLAMKHGLKPIGTHAHEWFMYHATKYGYIGANWNALRNWVQTYQGNLGIALTDTFTSDSFYRDFNTEYSKLFDGVRQDSGDPIEFLNKTVAHYKAHGIDPATKTIVFSDGLDLHKAIKLNKAAKKAGIGCSFGIGTNLTNDVGIDPLNIVIKLTNVRGHHNQWLPTVKLSDSLGKHTGELDEIRLCKQTLRLED